MSAIRGAIYGLCVGDALGVPVEFASRDELAKDPVTTMRGYGTYNMPPGTWSDDTSLTLCLLESLAKGLDCTDIMRRFHSWLFESAYTPHGLTLLSTMSLRSPTPIKEAISLAVYTCL